MLVVLNYILLGTNVCCRIVIVLSLQFLPQAHLKNKNSILIMKSPKYFKLFFTVFLSDGSAEFFKRLRSNIYFLDFCLAHNVTRMWHEVVHNILRSTGNLSTVSSWTLRTKPGLILGVLWILKASYTKNETHWGRSCIVSEWNWSQVWQVTHDSTKKYRSRVNDIRALNVKSKNLHVMKMQK